MSKIGKKLIDIPKGVQVQFQPARLDESGRSGGDGNISVKGAKGQLNRSIPASFSILINEDKVKITPVTDLKSKGSKETVMQWGLYRALIQNMITGVSSGFEKTLEFQGVGFKAVTKGSDLELSLGFSHPIFYKAPEGVTFKVEKGTIVISGIDREVVGQVAAEIRSKREPEPYKGSGIRYKDEVIQKKAGKKAIAAG